MGFLGCTPHSESSKKTLYVSILPLQTLVSSIVEDDFNLEVLVAAGASPETFEPTPKQFIALNKAQLIFSTGLINFEQSLLSKVEQKEKVINLSEGIEVIAGSCAHQHTCGVDPHIWTSPRELQIMAANAYRAIAAAYPDSVKYTHNFEQLQLRLQELDRKTSEQIAHSGVSCFLIYHPALTYYARAYGLQQIAIENEGKEPTAKRLSEMIGIAKEQNINRIFYQSQFPASSVEVIAHDIHGEAIAIDPLAASVLENIAHITHLITTR